jgi:hypothetical protein
MTGCFWLRLVQTIGALEFPVLQRRAVEAAPTPARRWTAPTP